MTALGSSSDGADAAAAASGGLLAQLQAERLQMHRDLQRCLQEIHQRDLLLQQINTKVGGPSPP